MDAQWYAVRVRSNFERRTCIALRFGGFEEYLPVYEWRWRARTRTRVTQRPLFPGYVFCRFDINYRRAILLIPGVLHILGQGRVPTPVDPAELAAVRTIAESGLPVEPCPFVGKLEPVCIVNGPLRGLEGVVIEVKKRSRLVVSISLLQRSVCAEVEQDWVIRPI